MLRVIRHLCEICSPKLWPFRLMKLDKVRSYGYFEATEVTNIQQIWLLILGQTSGGFTTPR